jgi:hypothetical protein
MALSNHERVGKALDILKAGPATQKASWDRTTTIRVGETFQWLLCL